MIESSKISGMEGGICTTLPLAYMETSSPSGSIPSYKLSKKWQVHLRNQEAGDHGIHPTSRLIH